MTRSQLRATLLRLVVASPLAHGCCGLLSSYRDGRWDGKIVVGRPATTRPPRDGWYEGAACAACGDGSKYCTPVTIAIAPRSPELRCTVVHDGQAVQERGDLPAGLDPATLHDGQALPLAVCTAKCSPEATKCEVDMPAFAATDRLYCERLEPGHCDSTIPAGRMPHHLIDRPRTIGSVGELLARCAELEAAAAIAFGVLDRELAAIDAPLRLRARVREAAVVELRHAALFTRLAGERGARPQALAWHPARERSLLELAVENAREGCGGETAGAFLAAHQARYARDPVLRAAHARVAADELDHAVLAWELHRWFCALLAHHEVAVVEREIAIGLAAPIAALAEIDPAVRVAAGLPPPAFYTEIAAELAGARR